MQLTAAVALAKRMMSRADSPRSSAWMNAARNTSPAPVVSTALHLDRGLVDHPIAVEYHRAARPERDAEQPGVAPADLAERAFGVVFAGDRRRHVFREDRDADGVDQRIGAIGDAIDIARRRHARLARQRGRENRRLLIDIVDVDQAR